MAIHFQCPTCGQAISVNEGDAGTQDRTRLKPGWLVVGAVFAVGIVGGLVVEIWRWLAEP